MVGENEQETILFLLFRGTTPRVKPLSKLSNKKGWHRKTIAPLRKLFCGFFLERRNIMLDIKFIRENKEKVKDNIRKKFQDEKLPLVDEIIELDSKIRKLKLDGDNIKAGLSQLHQTFHQRL